MDKKVLLIGLFVILGVVFVSGCTSDSNNNEAEYGDWKDAAHDAGMNDKDAEDEFEYMDKDNNGRLSEDEANDRVDEISNQR
jgi:outer membrane murein-binding lipoprotein Lpp